MVQTFIVGKDPDWGRQMNERWGRALLTLGQMMRKREEEEKQQMYRDLQLLQSDPGLINTSMGQQMYQKYKDVPGVAGILERTKELQDQNLREQNLTSDFYSRVAQQQQAEAAMREAAKMQRQMIPEAAGAMSGLGQMAAATAGFPSLGPAMNAMAEQAGMGSTWQSRADQAIAAAERGSPEWQAYMGMGDDERREMLRLQAERKVNIGKAPEDMTLPDELDLYRQTGDPLLGLQQELVKKGIEPTANAKLQMEAQQAAREAANADREARQRDRLELEREKARLRAERGGRGDETDKTAKKADAILGAMNSTFNAISTENAKLKDDKKTPLPTEEATVAAARIMAEKGYEKNLAAKKAKIAIEKTKKLLSDPKEAQKAKGLGLSFDDIWLKQLEFMGP